jgi:hypothetical protein
MQSSSDQLNLVGQVTGGHIDQTQGRIVHPPMLDLGVGTSSRARLWVTAAVRPSGEMAKPRKTTLPEGNWSSIAIRPPRRPNKPGSGSVSWNVS